MPRRFAVRPRRAGPPQVATTLLWCAIVCAFGCNGPARAATPNGTLVASEEEDLAQAYGDQPVVSIATGSPQTAARAPAITSVITAADIAAMGATDLDDVLEAVPGVHVARSTQGFSPVYVIRGVNLGLNPQVLMLINGVPITKLFAGNRGNVWRGYPVENIARVEVIRGPGSALYGADAAAGVINIITKTTADVQGTQVGLRAGAFDTYDGWTLYGGQWGMVNVEGYLRVGSTQGDRSTVQADAQTGWDSVMGTHVSHAPGPIDNQYDAVDGSLDFNLDKWRLRLAYTERLHSGSATGVASALDPTGDSRNKTFNADLSYSTDTWLPDLTMNFLVSDMHYDEFSDLVLYPPGFTLPTGTFTDGMIGNPYKWERRDIVSTDGTYTGFRQHRVRVGVGLEWASIYRVQESKNFNPDFSPIGTGSVGDVTDVTNTAPFMRPHSRQLQYAYGQDEWSLNPDWTLTAGLRYDHYSDFGDTTNPRLALVWDVAYNVTAKLLYGTAFRAPSFSELYAINNPVVSGNPALKPEKTKTTEAALSWQASPQLLVGANVFHYRMDNIIQLVDFVYENTGAMTGNGMECEATWTVSKTVKLSGNYSYQYATNDATDRDSGNAPHHQVYGRVDWRFMPEWAFDTQLNAISSRARVPGDTRPSLGGYTTVDVTVRTAGDGKGWQFAASVRNLFNADAREPSAYDESSGQPFISLPNDFPLPGRSFYVQASYKF